jgi:hypothetical protein
MVKNQFPVIIGRLVMQGLGNVVPQIGDDIPDDDCASITAVVYDTCILANLGIAWPGAIAGSYEDRQDR